MPKFSLLQLLVAVSLFPILGALVKTEFGGRQHFIGTIAFSNDDSKILISKISGRSTWGQNDLNQKNISRTLSWIDQQSEKTLKIVQQDYQPYESYSPFGYFWQTVALNPTNDHIAAIDFFGPSLCLNAPQGNRLDKTFSPALQLTFSGSGKFLAIYSFTGISIIKTKDKSQVLWIPREQQPIEWLLFSDDETKLYVSTSNSTYTWDLNETILIAKEANQLPPYSEPLARGPSDTLFASVENKLMQCAMSGSPITIIADESFTDCCISRDKKVLAAADANSIKVYNLDDFSLRNEFHIGSVRPMSLNSDGSLLAVGIHGRLALIDTKKAERIWTTTPPTRYGNPWYIPTSFLLVWLFIANRILGWNIRHKLNRFAARKRHPA